eukprot:sb/3466898/
MVSVKLTRRKVLSPKFLLILCFACTTIFCAVGYLDLGRLTGCISELVTIDETTKDHFEVISPATPDTPIQVNRGQIKDENQLESAGEEEVSAGNTRESGSENELQITQDTEPEKETTNGAADINVSPEDYSDKKYLNKLVEMSGITSRDKLDKMFNMDIVGKSLDLQNITFLDMYYYYNYEAVAQRMADRMEEVKRVCEQVNYKSYPQSYCYNLYQFKLIPNHLYKPVCQVSHFKRVRQPNEVYLFRGFWMLASMERGRQNSIPSSKRKDFKNEYNHYVDWLKDQKGEAPSHSEDNPYFDPPHAKFTEMVDAMAQYV